MWHINVCGVCLLPDCILPIGNIHTVMAPWDREDFVYLCVCEIERERKDERRAWMNSYEECMIDSEC